MGSEDLTRLQAALEAAEAEVELRRTENAALADAYRAMPTDEGKESLRRGAGELAKARERLEAARRVLRIHEKTGSEHGLIAEGDRVVGTIAVKLSPGISQKERIEAITAALNEPLYLAAEELGVLVSTSPERYTRERPGRDAAGRTVLEVAGRVEGDVLVPAVSGRATRRT